MKKHISPTAPPLISILIPVRDDLKNLRTCLQSLSRENGMENAELLICDDGSSPPLAEKTLRDIIPETILYQIKGSGPAKARNHLAEKARGEYLFFVDADTEFSGKTLETARKIIKDNPGIGAFIGSYDDEPGIKTIVSSYKNLSHHYVHHKSAGKVSTFWTGCGVINRQIFLEFGGFNEHYLKPSIEDIELGMRMSAQDREIRLFPELQVKHNKQWTISNWLKTDLLLRGIPWIRLMATRKQWIPQLNFTVSHRLSAVLVLILLPGIPAAFFYPPIWWLILMLFLAFITLNHHFFRFLVLKTGFWHAAAMVPLHMLYYLTAALSLALGLVSAIIHGPLDD
jgi:glycosyltransferase involved in cell wall biosynthesis